ncbi:sensor histidine kinase [Streptomyces himalayensis]|uniref:histidine kinase n=1 Tax=Streptomyces himalayensis subsp. himalayensis TaxID=2756131 RepID=A0A7W0DKC7_9ACTN|nr:histidine kinase [Streptomyces himalayensis]MBA2946646.1 two-component sensor histidine kinase [Streptomyces himalayensis subsp. himalayensis]
MIPRRLTAPLLNATLVAAALVDVWVNVDPAATLRMTWALAAAVALLLRRRLPLLTFLLSLPAVLLSDAIFAALAALYTLASLTRSRILLAVCALAFTLSDMTSWPSPNLDLFHPPTLITLGYTAATAAAPVFLGQLVQARRDLSLRLAEISEARDHERLLTAQAVLAKERAQLAREMHDVVSHQVSLIAVRAGALQVGTRDAEAKEAAATIRRLSVQTLDELRHMVSVLRASGGRPAELTPQPSLADLQRLVDSSGIEAELTTDLPGSPPPTVQRAIYRTVQEALTNVRKHAPGATATVHIAHEGGAVRVTVTNTAPTRPALPLPSAHYGLVGLRQRAALLGGTVTSGPTPEGGYQLRLELPAEGTA